MKFKFSILQFIFMVIVMMLAIAWFRNAHREKSESPPAESKQHVHQWNKWSEPAKSSDWYNGTWFTQSRTCETCGEAQIREVKISAHAEK